MDYEPGQMMNNLEIEVNDVKLAKLLEEMYPSLTDSLKLLPCENRIKLLSSLGNVLKYTEAVCEDSASLKQNLANAESSLESCRIRYNSTVNEMISMEEEFNLGKEGYILEIKALRKTVQEFSMVKNFKDAAVQTASFTASHLRPSTVEGCCQTETPARIDMHQQVDMVCYQHNEDKIASDVRDYMGYVLDGPLLTSALSGSAYLLRTRKHESHKTQINNFQHFHQVPMKFSPFNAFCAIMSWIGGRYVPHPTWQTFLFKD